VTSGAGGAANVAAFVSPAGTMKTLRIEPVFVAEGVTSLREAVSEGLAISVLPNWLVGDDLAKGRLVPVLPRWSSRPIPLNLIYLAERQRPARVQAFIAFAEANLPAMI
jgi:DNA-binding transcriptional LysR family regulator